MTGSLQGRHLLLQHGLLQRVRVLISVLAPALLPFSRLFAAFAIAIVLFQSFVDISFLNISASEYVTFE